MATTGPMADFARLPNDRKVLVFVVIGGLLGLLYYQFAFKALKEDLENAEQANQTKSAMNVKLGNDIPEYEKLKTRMKDLEERIARNQEALPTEAEVPAFFEMLERKIKQSGVEIARWTKLPEAAVGAFKKVPVEIELTGSFMQIKRFFASLVQKDVSPTAGSSEGEPERERVVSIENLQLTNPIVKNREILLSAKFVAVTYRQEEAQAPAGAAAPPPQATTAPKPPMPTAPPPSAATPAGAKARTEDAIKKGDAVDRNAAGVDEAKTPAGSGEGSARLKGGL
ncbi:MAG: type 4a pilus biogenesis protein PilO [Kofleriaceae bacterium]|nr:type 4a pilus biogenesis protein PilO [Kofleriaceae bacterium]